MINERAKDEIYLSRCVSLTLCVCGTYCVKRIKSNETMNAKRKANRLTTYEVMFIFFFVPQLFWSLSLSFPIFVVFFFLVEIEKL